MKYTILLVDSNPDTRVERARLLSSAGYVVVAVATFAEASDRIAVDPPDLLITDVRLGEFNGLHLVVRSRRERSDMATLVTHDVSDRVLEAEAARLGAEFLFKSVDPTVLLDAVRRMLADHPRAVHAEWGRRWARFYPARPVQVVVSDRQGQVVDLAFGGLGLVVGQAPAGDAAGRMALRFPESGLTVDARLVWCRSSESGDEWRCGFELTGSEENGTPAWQEFAVSVMTAAT